MLDKPNSPLAFHAETAPGVSALRRAFWDAATGESAEGWDYHAACEAAGMVAGAVVVKDLYGPAVAAPLFEIVYPLDTPLQGKLAGPARALRRCAPKIMEWKALGVGSALSEQAHVALRSDLDGPSKKAAISALIDGVESEARRRGAAIVAFKDLAPADEGLLGPALAARRYTAIRSLPVAVLDLREAKTADDYLATLSASTRKDIRRKLRGSGALRVERRMSVDDDDLVRIRQLYRETQTSSEVHYGDFEELPDGYFEQMAQLGPERARFTLYFADDRLIAFNLLLLAPDRVIDKFIGMSYPLARDHDVYAVSWMDNVAFALSTGRRYLQTGQTAYADKLRFGSALEARTIYAKHRFPPLNAALRRVAGLLAFDRWDPVLRKLRHGRDSQPVR